MYETYHSQQIVNVYDEEQGIIGEVVLYDVEPFMGRDSRYCGVVITGFTLDNHSYTRGQHALLHYDNLRPNPQYPPKRFVDNGIVFCEFGED